MLTIVVAESDDFPWIDWRIYSVIIFYQKFFPEVEMIYSVNNRAYVFGVQSAVPDKFFNESYL